jgi:predicted Zn finger-like uncharacterized protein
MILTCPDCASRYVVDDARIGPNGRTVRCASCGVSWRADRQIAEASAPLDLSETVTPEAPADRPAPLPKRLRAEAQEKRKSRQAVAAGVAWAALGAGFVAVMLGAVLFRVNVVRLWPQTASAYAFAKMPVNPTGLALETVQGQPNLIGGHAALSVTGVERNVETGARLSMPLRVVLYDKAGKRLISAVSAPPVRPIAPGDTRPFAVNFIDPPVDGSSFVVEFAFDKVRPPGNPLAAPARGAHAPVGGPKLVQTAAAAPQPAPVLHAKEAMSVPADSPYALPAAAGPQAAH